MVGMLEFANKPCGLRIVLLQHLRFVLPPPTTPPEFDILSHLNGMQAVDVWNSGRTDHACTQALAWLQEERKRNGTELQRCTDVGPAGESNAAAAGAAGPSSCLRFVEGMMMMRDDEVVVVVAGYAGPCWQLLPSLMLSGHGGGNASQDQQAPQRVG